DPRLGQEETRTAVIRRFVHARYGIENGRLIRTFDWIGILGIDSGRLVFSVLSSRRQNIRISLLALLPLVMAFFTMITFSGWLTPYLFSHLPDSWAVGIASYLLVPIVA